MTDASNAPKPIRPGAAAPTADDPPKTATPLPGAANAAAPPGLTKSPKAPAGVKPMAPVKPAEKPSEAQEKPESEAEAKVVAPQAPKKLPPLPFKIEAIGVESEDDISDDWLRIIIYGPSGVGKTYLIGTAQDDPETNSVYLIDAESGKTTIRFKKGIMRSKVTTYSEVESIVDFLRKYFTFRDALLTARKNNDEKEIARFETNMAILFRIEEADRATWEIPIFRTVAVDSLTEVQVYDMKEIMEEVVKSDSSRDPDVPSPREWGRSQTHIKDLIRALRAMPCHSIFAALPVERQDEKTKEINVWPDLPGKLATQVPALVDIVGYYYSYIDDEDNTQRILLTQNTGKYVAKDRTNALGKFVVNPTIPMLFQMKRDYDAKMAQVQQS